MTIKTVCVDISKSVFHTLGFDKNHQQIHKKKYSRQQFTKFLSDLPPSDVVLEACGTSHYWGRTLNKMGHRAFLISARRVSKFVDKEAKNDYNDAMGIYCAYCQPSTKYVAVKSEEQQSLSFLHRNRCRLVSNRTQIANQVRSFLHELGLVVPLGRSSVVKKAYDLLETTNYLMAVNLHELLNELEEIEAHIKKIELSLKNFAKSNLLVQRLMRIPGVGLITATALLGEVADFRIFSSGREFAAWLGLVPSQYSTGGKTILGRITKAGNQYLRKLLVQGANSIAMSISRHTDKAHQKPVQWMKELLERHPKRNKVCIAMANKLARIIWAIIAHDRDYDGEYISTPPVYVRSKHA